MKAIASRIVRMATENPGWGYTRIRAALTNLGHGVARSTVAKLLKADSISPAPDRPSSWRTFLRAHWGTIAGSTPTPDAGFIAQAAGRSTDAVDGFLAGHRVLLCDRDRKWTEGFR
jgi:hypothetical protein